MQYYFFLKRWLLLSFIIAAIIIALGFVPQFQPMRTFTWSSFLFYFLISPLVAWLGIKGVKNKNNHQFVSYIMAALTGKLLLAAAFVFIYFFLSRPHSPAFVFPFFLLYVFYTVLEVYFLLKSINKTDSVIND